jgi:hypothetical protein
MRLLMKVGETNEEVLLREINIFSDNYDMKLNLEYFSVFEDV